MASSPLSAVASPGGAILAVYHAKPDSVRGEISSPAQQGWQERGNEKAQTSAIWDVAAEGDIPAWRIDNVAPAENGASTFYQQKLDPAALRGAEGWTATARLRVSTAPGNGPNVCLSVHDGQSRWQVGFIHNPSQGSRLYYRDHSDQLISIGEVNLSQRYVTLQIYYDPMNDAVQLFLDGRTVGDVLRREAMATVPANRVIIEWGDCDASPRTHRADAYWSHVELLIGRTVAEASGL